MDEKRDYEKGCGRCGLVISGIGIDATFIDQWEQTETKVLICDSCDRDLDSRRIFVSRLPLWCADPSCGHWLGTVYYTGSLTVPS